MDALDRVRTESVGRVLGWRGDYPGGPTMLTSLHTQLETQYNDVLAGEGDAIAKGATTASEYDVKGGDLQSLADMLSEMSDLADAMEPLYPGIHANYPYTRNMNQSDTLATARAFIAKAPADKPKFVDAGMPVTFIADLTGLADGFQSQSSGASEALVMRVGTNAAQKAKVRQMMITKKSFVTIAKIAFKTDPAALASLASAAHVENIYPDKKNGGGPTP